MLKKQNNALFFGFTLLFFLALSFSGCAFIGKQNQPYFSAAQKAMPKNYARVYVYNPYPRKDAQILGFTNTLSPVIFIDYQKVVDLSNQTYSRFFVPAGVHIAGVTLGEGNTVTIFGTPMYPKKKTLFFVAAGKTYYFKFQKAVNPWLKGEKKSVSLSSYQYVSPRILVLPSPYHKGYLL